MYKISLITGDGIGPELSESAISVLNTIQEKYGIEFRKGSAGGMGRAGYVWCANQFLRQSQIRPGYVYKGKHLKIDL